MSNPIYISRNFTEFGAFTVAEVLDFYKRGIVRDSDYARVDGSGDWTPIPDWVAAAPAPEAAPELAPVVAAEAIPATTPPAPKAAKKAAAKKAPAAPKAKKAAKKAAPPEA